MKVFGLKLKLWKSFTNLIHVLFSSYQKQSYSLYYQVICIYSGLQGYHNPALDIEPHYDDKEDVVFHERHFKSTFEPLVPSKYEGDSFPQNIPPVMTTGNRGKVLPAISLDKASPYFVPPTYQLMEKHAKKKRKRRSKRKIANRDHPEEAYLAGRETPPTQMQRDTAKLFTVSHHSKEDLGPSKQEMEHERGYAKIYPSTTGKMSENTSINLTMFSSPIQPPHHWKKDAKLQKVHPLPDNRGGFENNMTSTPKDDLTNQRNKYVYNNLDSESEVWDVRLVDDDEQNLYCVWYLITVFFYKCFCCFCFFGLSAVCTKDYFAVIRVVILPSYIYMYIKIINILTALIYVQNLKMMHSCKLLPYQNNKFRFLNSFFLFRLLKSKVYNYILFKKFLWMLRYYFTIW